MERDECTGNYNRRIRRLYREEALMRRLREFLRKVRRSMAMNPYWCEDHRRVEEPDEFYTHHYRPDEYNPFADRWM